MNKVWDRKRIVLAIGIIGTGVLILMLAMREGGQLVEAIAKKTKAYKTEAIRGGLIKKTGNEKGDKFYLNLADYGWKTNTTIRPKFRMEVIPINDNWEQVRTLVGKNVEIEGIENEEGGNLTISQIKEATESEDIGFKGNLDTSGWQTEEIKTIGIKLNYPANTFKKKTGIFNGETTWVWEGLSGETGDVWGITIGSDKPWGAQSGLCEGENWGCRQIGMAKIKIGDKLFEVPIWLTKSGGRIFQFKIDTGMGQTTATGYFGIKSEGQMIVDVLTTIR